MKKLLSITDKAKRIAFDTCIFIYYFENNKKYTDVLDKLFEKLESTGKPKLILSTLLLTELMVHPYKQNRLGVAQKWLDYFKLNEWIIFTDIIPTIAIEAARLRAKYGFKTSDSIHLANALVHKADYFLANDITLKKCKEIAVFHLDEYVK